MNSKNQKRVAFITLLAAIILFAPIIPSSERPSFIRYASGAAAPALLGWNQYQGCYYNSLQSSLHLFVGIGLDIRLNTPNATCPLGT